MADEVKPKTAAELIAMLQALPPDAVVGTEDEDGPCGFYNDRFVPTEVIRVRDKYGAIRERHSFHGSVKLWPGDTAIGPVETIWVIR